MDEYLGLLYHFVRMDSLETILNSSLLLDLETALDGTILKVGAVSGQ